ncbi:hypothetical protein CDCA_CDCA01G0003 [Cyanidium caldarium]|uniref:Uncharacterized protein n=1 Tax=Cyanidium caldarium TaxID=2771 RepID=A0AAV9IPP9_CYACA|nr:hypothetical protein CDCA_CDCA01G0003 [Cyanidium caldarium]
MSGHELWGGRERKWGTAVQRAGHVVAVLLVLGLVWGAALGAWMTGTFGGGGDGAAWVAPRLAGSAKCAAHGAAAALLTLTVALGWWLWWCRRRQDGPVAWGAWWRLWVNGWAAAGRGETLSSGNSPRRQLSPAAVKVATDGNAAVESWSWTRMAAPASPTRCLAWMHGAVGQCDASSQTSLTWPRLEALEREHRQLLSAHTRLRRERDELEKALLVNRARLAAAETLASRAEELEKRHMELVHELAHRDERLEEEQRRGRKAKAALSEEQKRLRDVEHELSQLQQQQLEEAEKRRRQGTDGVRGVVVPASRRFLGPLSRRNAKEWVRILESRLALQGDELQRLRAVVEQLSSGYASDVAASCISNIDMDDS